MCVRPLIFAQTRAHTPTHTSRAATKQELAEWRARKQQQQAAQAAAQQEAQRQAHAKQQKAWAAKVHASKQALQHARQAGAPKQTQQPARPLNPPSLSTMLSIAERNVILLEKRRAAVLAKKEAEQRAMARKEQLLAQAHAAVAPRVARDKSRVLQPTMAVWHRQNEECPKSSLVELGDATYGGKATPSWRAGVFGL